MGKEQTDRTVILQTKAYNASTGKLIALAVMAVVIFLFLPKSVLQMYLIEILAVAAVAVVAAVLYGMHGHCYYIADERGITRCSLMGKTTEEWEQFQQAAIVWCGIAGGPDCNGIILCKKRVDYELDWRLTADKHAANYWARWFYLSDTGADYDTFPEQELRKLLEKAEIPYTDHSQTQRNRKQREDCPSE